MCKYIRSITEDNMNNNNTIGIIVAGLVAFLAIVVTGKWLLDKHHHQKDCAPAAVAPMSTPPTAAPTTPAPTQPTQPPVIVVPGGGPYPYHYPEYHSNQEFWRGYNDGWNGFRSTLVSPAYLRGYEIGAHDRRLGRHYYYDRYYPPGFHLRVPGFRLDIR